MIRRSSMLYLAAAALSCAGPTPTPTSADAERLAVLATIGSATAGPRPQYDIEGTRLVYAVGGPGARNVAVHVLADQTTHVFDSPSDDIDPTWTPDGRIVFSSNRSGTYDLWVLDPASRATEQVTDFEGDEFEPTVAAVAFGFYAVRDGVCGGEATGTPVDAYHKVLFTRRVASSSEVWFASLRPTATPRNIGEQRDQPVQPSAHATHQGRVSPDSRSCSNPSFAGDGLSAVWVCNGTVYDAAAKYEQSFQAALATVKTKPAPECSGWDADFAACLPKLARSYTTYPGKAVSTTEEQITSPSISANQTVLLADREGAPMMRARFAPSAPWSALPIDVTDARRLVWSPTGAEIAFESGGQVLRTDTDFYLQTVRNLDRFPELYGDGQSTLLQQNRFVVRPAKHKEFYVLHDELRYAERPQFISADVALQVFRDEFLRLIEHAEKDAATSTHALSRALMDHYVARLQKSKQPIDRYYAVLFATAWAPLEAAATMERVSGEDLMEVRMNADSDDVELKARVNMLTRPVADRLPQEIGRVWPAVPAAIRSDVMANVAQMLSHEGIRDVQIPGEKRPFKIDFSQFKIRGAYAENDLGAYFLAMNWYGNMPLPIAPSLGTLTSALQSVRVGDKTALQAWARVDAMVGSFMGRPVDATVQHVVNELQGNAPFDEQALLRKLEDLRGPVPIRDANGGDRKIAVTLFPKRVGLDVTYFRALTHPDVKGRGMPTALDVFATLGNRRAAVHAATSAPELADAYRKNLDALSKRTPQPGADRVYWSTDIYHSWLAALVALAQPFDVPDTTMIEFSNNDAWRDRQLYSALAGYTQLKHSAVLYAMQDIGVECDGESSYYVAVEQPLVPRPLGFVEPNVAFYEALAALAQRSYRTLGDDPAGPTADRWAAEGDPRVNALNFANDLAAIAKREVDGLPITDDQARFIEYIGRRLEQLTIAMEPTAWSFSTGGDGRQQRGVALVTDIHTNSQRAEALHIAIGRIFNLWAIVPSGVGERLTQGGALSFYEFTAPMSDRLTDAQWADRVDKDALPPRPVWTKSFIEDR